MPKAIYCYLSIRLADLLKNILELTLLKYLIAFIVRFFIFSFRFFTLFSLFFGLREWICLGSFNRNIPLPLICLWLYVGLLLLINWYWLIQYCVLFLHWNIISKKIIFRFKDLFCFRWRINTFFLLINNLQFWLAFIPKWFLFSEDGLSFFKANIFLSFHRDIINCGKRIL
jgi:hypothetical protein